MSNQGTQGYKIDKTQSTNFGIVVRMGFTLILIRQKLLAHTNGATLR